MIEIARFITPFFAPLSMGLLCVLLGFFCLLLRRQKTALLALTFGLGIFIFFGYGLTTRQQLHDLERQYPPLAIKQIPSEIRQKIQYVVVLGSSHTTDPGIPETGQIGGSSLYRLVEGISIQRQLPQTKLVISGGVNQNSRPNALVVSRVAELIGVNATEMIIEDRPRDTFEEAKLLQPLLVGTTFILVTSAAHMARAMKLFQDSGMKPIAAPTDFILKDNQQLTPEDILPSCGNLGISKRVIYEWLGTLWGRVKEKISE